MIGKITFPRVIAAAVGLALVLFAIGWMSREDPSQKPYLQFTGGGFILNYRLAEAFYGFSVQVQKPLRTGSIIEAEFEDPQGGPPLVVSERVNARTTRYGMRSPGVKGVEAGRPYKVVVSLYDYRGETLIERHEREYSSRIASSTLPEKALTVGPGYHRNREGREAE
jgi:hypothetical protein